MDEAFVRFVNEQLGEPDCAQEIRRRYPVLHFDLFGWFSRLRLHQLPLPDHPILVRVNDNTLLAITPFKKPLQTTLFYYDASLSLTPEEHKAIEDVLELGWI